MQIFTWPGFEKVELRVEKILQVLAFPEARKPACKLRVDSGEFGFKYTSAQITKHYQPKIWWEGKLLA